eukprot:jgi/Ulvmu1/6256/UM028_0114.1
MSTFGGLATEVTSARDLNGRTAEQCVQERRNKDEVDLYEYARRHSIDGPLLITSDEDTDRIPAKPQLFKLADLIFQGPRAGETFAESIAKRAKDKGVPFPEIFIEYTDVTVTTGALIGSAALPSLPNAAVGRLQGVIPGAKKTTELKILNGVTGVLKPGRMTLLLGPPVSGKSTFLKLLAGRLKGESGLATSGEVLYNGRRGDAFVLERSAAYIDQADQHLPAQNVHDLLKFAWKCQSGGSTAKPSQLRSQKTWLPSAMEAHPHGEVDLSFLETGELPPGGLSDAQFDALVDTVAGTSVKVDVIMKMMGLWHTRDTVVGNEMTRGVSGGERHRVTTAEMLVGPRRMLMMDEISTGLDSATLESVITTLANLTHSFRLTTLIGLLQPPPELFDIFDDVLLLSEGYVIYHGPVSDAMPFLESCGFKCPTHKDQASFMQEVTSINGQLEFATDELRSAMKIPPLQDLQDVIGGKAVNPFTECPLSSSEISRQFYERDQHGLKIKEDLAGRIGNKGSKDALLSHRYALSPLHMLKVVCDRQLKLALAQGPMNRARLVQVIVIAFMIGTLWFDLGVSALNARSFTAVSFMSILFLSLGAMPQLNAVTISKPIFFKQRDNLFFAPACYAIGLWWQTVPFAIVEAVVFSVIVYFMVGFTFSVSAYFTFLLIVITIMNAFSSWIRLLAAIAPSQVVATSLASTALLILVVFAGFSIVKDSIPSWWTWAYYVSPLSWGLQAIVINEMTQDRWKGPLPADPTRTVGETALQAFDMRSDREFIWWGALYHLGTFLVMTGLTALVLSLIQAPRTPSVVPDPKVLAQYREEARKRKEELAAQESDGDGNKLPFTPVTITCINLCYFVPNPHKGAKEDLQLLRGITATLQPGALCALMGGSGAGKTTAMDVIAARKTVGRTSGDILINGYPMEQGSWSRNLGYVEQMDIHSPQLTVYESLEVSARLRLPRDTSSTQIQNQIANTLQMVDLVEAMGSMVGTGNGVGLSTEQRKRLTIAVELVANPAAIFMDEPTSGLDARAAAIVIRSVKSVAQSGRTVMVVVHQPSIDIFYSFDYLMLFAKGGRMIYNGQLGTHSSALVDYLSAIPGTAPLPPGANPATWMLQVTGGSMAAGGDAATVAERYAQAYADSDLAASNRRDAEASRHGAATAHKNGGDAAQGPAAVSQDMRSSNGGGRLQVSSKYAQSWWTQLTVLSNKFRVIYWRKPDYNLMRFVMTVVIALALGSIFFGLGDLPTPTELADVQNVLGVLFTSVSFMGMVNLINAVPVVVQERGVYYRERAASMYSALPFALAAGSVEIPYILAQALVYSPIVFFLVQFKNDGGWEFWYFTLMVTLTVCIYTFMGQALAYLTASPQTAIIMASGLSFVFNVFNGFARPYPEMPQGWKWLNRIVPTTWVMMGLTVSQLGDNEQEFVDPQGNRSTVKAFLDDQFGFKYSWRWTCAGISLAYVLVFRLLGAAALRFLNFQRR